MIICVAEDEAFNFTYRANIDALRRIGKIIMCSPLCDTSLPECDMLYLPGGYPELFAAKLSSNTNMLQSVSNYAEAGGYIFAECGGFMYLCRKIDEYQLCGVFPFEATMEGSRLHLGYRQMVWNGKVMRGHEFHYSSLRHCPLPSDVTELKLQSTALGKPVDTAIYRYKNVFAGYTHWYWAEQICDFGSSFPFFPNL